MISNASGISNVRVVSFTIEEINDRFYANGRHQCQIRISVLKQGEDSSGQMVKVPLSTREKFSLRPVAFSSSLDVNNLWLPGGWTYTNTRNIYDLGTITSSLLQPAARWMPADPVPELEGKHSGVTENQHEERQGLCMECLVSEKSSSEIQVTGMAEPYNANIVPDTFDFYISSSATGTQHLMATMQFDVMNDMGMLTNTMTLTTNMSDNNNNIFNSSIRLTAIQPVIINSISPVLRTIENRQEDMNKWDVHHQTITLYTWQLPYNLRSISRTLGNTTRQFYNLGNTHESNRFLTRGRFYAQGRSNVNARDNMGGGCVWDSGYSVDVSDRQICADVLQVTGCSWSTSMHSGTHDMTMIDNFGTEHRFRVSPMDTGKTLTLHRVGN